MSEQHTYAGHTLAEIKAAAEAATPGPWQTGGDTVEQQGSGRIVYHVLTSEYCMERLESLDAIYGATANPATVLAMAARIEELEQQVTCATADHAAALRLVGDVCQVIGYNGKLMTGELMQYVDDLAKGAARYRQLRRGQHWNVIDGIGKSLRADELDAAIDAAMEQTKNREGA